MVVALATIGCTAADEALVMTDTTGESFEVACSGASCRVTPFSDELPLPRCDVDEQPGYSFSTGHFVVLAAVCIDSDGDWISWSHWRRPASCASSSDCPELLGNAFECRAGLCQNADLVVWPENLVNRFDVRLLCLAPIERSATIDSADSLDVLLAVEQLVIEACGESSDNPYAPCILPLPDDCWQPI